MNESFCVFCATKKTIFKKQQKQKKKNWPLFWSLCCRWCFCLQVCWRCPRTCSLVFVYQSLTFYLSTFFAVCGDEWSVCGPNAPDISTAEVGGARDCSDSWPGLFKGAWRQTPPHPTHTHHHHPQQQATKHSFIKHSAVNQNQWLETINVDLTKKVKTSESRLRISKQKFVLKCLKREEN